MPTYFQPWDNSEEPNEQNIKIWMDNTYGKFESIEQARWNQSNIDTLFYAGEQRFINSYFNFYPQYNWQTFYFNFIQQPVNMVTGYQRQHRKSISYIPVEGTHQDSADDLTKLVKYGNSYRQILEKFSIACEQSAISGMVMMQPFLDFTDDPINGTLDLKVWSFNSFIVDPYFRQPDMSDANFVWCQQYVSKQEAMNYFPHEKERIRTMSGYGNRYGKFYFLPENYNLARNDLLVLSYVWYKSKRTKKMLYDHVNGMSYDYDENDETTQMILDQIDTFEVIDVDVPTWKVCVVLNEQLMYQGNNPMGFDECPLIPVYWNYDPHISQYTLRVRSLVRSMRDCQFLLNRRVILNHDISESSINSGYIRKEKAIVNEEDLRYSGQGKDIIVKEGYELTDIQKIVPNAVPPSDIELSNQLVDFINRVSGVNQELMGMAIDDKAGITEMLRQGAGLVTLQKYFDQWDYSLKLLGVLERRLVCRWSPAKMRRILGKDPSPELQSKTFGKYETLVEEGLNTSTQQQEQFIQILKLNEILGGIIPTKFILEKSTIQGKNEIIAAVEEKEKQAAQMQQEQNMLQQTMLEAQMQNMHAKSVADIAMARERHGRAESNVGLFEERLSQITQNRASAIKDKVESLAKLLEIGSSYADLQTLVAATQLESLDEKQIAEEDREKLDAKMTSETNNNLNLMQNNQPQNNIQEEQRRSALL